VEVSKYLVVWATTTGNRATKHTTAKIRKIVPW
jgi:hypothetical protein